MDHKIETKFDFDNHQCSKVVPMYLDIFFKRGLCDYLQNIWDDLFFFYLTLQRRERILKCSPCVVRKPPRINKRTIEHSWIFTQNERLTNNATGIFEKFVLMHSEQIQAGFHLKKQNNFGQLQFYSSTLINELGPQVM